MLVFMSVIRRIVLVLLCVVSCIANAESNRIAELDFNNIMVGDALRILSKQSGLNIITSKKAANIEMTLYLNDVKPMDVLEAMAKTYNLWYQQDAKTKIIRLYTLRELRLGQVDDRNEMTEIFTFKHQNTSLDFAYAIQDLFGYHRVYFSQGADDDEVMKDLESRMERFEVLAQKSTIQANLGGSSGGNSSNSSNNTNNGNGNNNGNDNSSASVGNSSNGNRVSSSVNNISTQNTANTTNNLNINTRSQGGGVREKRQKGADDGNTPQVQASIYVTLVKRQNRVIVRTRDTQALNEIKALFKQLNIEMTTLLLEVKVLQLDLSDGYESSVDFSVNSGNTQFNHVDTVKNGSFLNELGEVSQLVGAASGNPSMVAGLVTKNFDMRLRLMEQEGRVTELATPMLTTTNQEVSRIFIGEERPITTGISVECSDTLNEQGTVIGQGRCVQDPQTEIRTIGKTLLLTPNINADGTVDIRILVEDSNVCILCGNILAANEGGLANYEVDTVENKTFTGNIIANNAQMIAVGGLINDKTRDMESKIPLLGDIPYLGSLFTNTEKVREHTEMVILIRPYVMTNHKETTDVNKQWLEQNSTHPAADKLNRLGMYENSEHVAEGFTLKDNYKTYHGQDSFDNHHDKGDFAAVAHQENKEVEHQDVQNRQATYVELTQYAAKAVRGNAPTVSKIQPVSLKTAQAVEVQYDTRLQTVPVGSWRKGGVHITALKVSNPTKGRIIVNYQRLKGTWLAATIEKEELSAQTSSYLYLISSDTFENTLVGANQ